MTTTRSGGRIATSRRTHHATPAQRLLRTASKLFAAQGIRQVGIDQILREAGVAKASLYSSYGSKEALVIAYLDDLDQADRNRWSDAVADTDAPAARVLAFFDLAAGAAQRRDFAGCLYANAATEFPGVDFEPVLAHREWVRLTIVDLLRQLHGKNAGSRVGSEADATATQIQLIYDGALLGSKLTRSVAPIKAGRALAAELIAGFGERCSSASTRPGDNQTRRVRRAM
jgi:AcrR family transcriptional regulator